MKRITFAISELSLQSLKPERSILVLHMFGKTLKFLD